MGNVAAMKSRTLLHPEARAEILRRIEALTPRSERRWGRMTPHQMVCHLSDCFRMATGERPVSHATSLLHRTIVKWTALYLPMSWRPGIQTRPETDQTVGGTKPGDFAADVAELEALVDLITTGSRAEWQLHPVFGKMSGAAWLRWGYLHMDHHLRQFGALGP